MKSICDKAMFCGCGACENIYPSDAVKLDLPTENRSITKDNFIRSTSTSGGIFTELSKVIIGMGGKVYGASFEV